MMSLPSAAHEDVDGGWRHAKSKAEYARSRAERADTSATSDAHARVPSTLENRTSLDILSLGHPLPGLPLPPPVRQRPASAVQLHASACNVQACWHGRRLRKRLQLIRSMATKSRAVRRECALALQACLDISPSSNPLFSLEILWKRLLLS